MDEDAIGIITVAASRGSQQLPIRDDNDGLKRA
jgi:hypothetical protein